MTEVVIDPGSFSIKAGLSAADSPSVSYRSLVGQTRNKDNLSEYSTGQLAIDSCAKSNGKVRLRAPIEEGYIDNFDLFERVIDDIYQSELSLDPEEHPVVMAEPHFNPPKVRSKTLEMFFEHLKVPEMNLTPQGVLSLIGTGRITGLVVDCGHAASTTIPIFESYVVPHSINRIKLGGTHVDSALAKLLSLNGIAKLTKTRDRETLRQLKESSLVCRSSAEDPNPAIPNTPFKLPDGATIVTLGSEVWKAPEVLFQPQLLSLESRGISVTVFDSVKSSPIDLTKPFLSNIVICGGTSQLKGFERRLTSDVKNIVAAKVARDVRIASVPEPSHSAWVGGKVFAGLKDGFQERWISRTEFFEHGPDRFLNSNVN